MHVHAAPSKWSPPCAFLALSAGSWCSRASRLRRWCSGAACSALQHLPSSARCMAAMSSAGCMGCISLATTAHPDLPQCPPAPNSPFAPAQLDSKFSRMSIDFEINKDYNAHNPMASFHYPPADLPPGCNPHYDPMDGPADAAVYPTYMECECFELEEGWGRKRISCHAKLCHHFDTNELPSHNGLAPKYYTLK